MVLMTLHLPSFLGPKALNPVQLSKHGVSDPQLFKFYLTISPAGRIFPSCRYSRAPARFSTLSSHRPLPNFQTHASPDSALSVLHPEVVSTEGLSFVVFEASSEAHLRAAANLRVRVFYEFGSRYGAEEHRNFLAKMELQALKERISGIRQGFTRVACVVATTCNSDLLSPKDGMSLFKVDVQMNGMPKEQLLVGSLDLNQALLIPDELCGSRPKGPEAGQRRAYLSNVCVATELHRRGIGSALIHHAKKIAWLWDISDLYVHVAADNEAAKRLYEKSGFMKEKEERASDARLMGRPRRILLWTDLSNFDVR